MTDSAINIMAAVSENEGNLYAVNTWDNAIMTFGMFQWTAGVESSPGELPALLRKIKDADEAVFQEYFGRHGLDVIEADETSGFFSLNGQRHYLRCAQVISIHRIKKPWPQRAEFHKPEN
ncbi:MAG: hypothetical protein P8X90_34605 [Desulfobacterales bacterium]